MSIKIPVLTRLTDLLRDLNSLTPELDNLQEEIQALQDERQSLGVANRELEAEKKKLGNQLRSERGVRSELEGLIDEQRLLIAQLEADLRELRGEDYQQRTIL